MGRLLCGGWFRSACLQPTQVGAGQYLLWFLLSFNQYPGWYNEPGNLSYPAVLWPLNAQWAQTNFPNKPFTISETGGGGIYSWTNSTPVYWSQM